MSENLYEREGAGEMPIQSAQAAGLEGQGAAAPDEVAQEAELAEETREAEAEAGPLEDAVEEAEDDEETGTEA